MPASAALARAEVEAEQIRLFFRASALQASGVVRSLLLLAVIGAASVGFVVWLFSSTSISRIAAWCSMILACECLLTAVNLTFKKRNPRDNELLWWARWKTVLCGVNALGWSLGPILLHVPGSTVTVLAPARGIVNFVGNAVWAGAYYTPSMFALMFGATVPASLWLAATGGEVEVITSICLLVSLPFMTFIGLIAAKRSEEAIRNRLEIATLLQERDVQARQIEALYNERTRFFSAASHDLRQPLNAMGFYFALLSRASVQTERQEIVHRLEECAAGLQRQFDAIMGVAETDSAVSRAIAEPIAISEILRKVHAMLEPAALQKSLRFRVAQTSLLGFASADVLERCVLNLAANAIKYTQAGTVLMGARRRGDTVEVQVLDTGIGIPESQMEKIFDDFYQVGNRARNREHGLGIGLGIVKRLSDAMDWKIETQSTLRRGSCFGIVIPLSLNEVPASSVQPPLAEPAAADRAVLIVDDDVLIRDSVGRMVSGWGFETRLCGSGDEALAFLGSDGSAKQWHVLLDYRLDSDRTGIEIADEIARQFPGRSTVTLMTGEISPKVEQLVRERGLGLLRKPVRPIRLRATLSSAFTMGEQHEVFGAASGPTAT